jgi:ABC-2 type transport system permease protein
VVTGDPDEPARHTGVFVLMLRTIAAKEFTDTLRDGRFRWGGAVVLGLLLVALGSGWVSQRELTAAHTAADAQTWEHWFAQGEKNPHSAAHYGVYAFKPVSWLGLVDQGVNPYVGVATWLEAHRQNPFEYRPAQDATAVARFGVLTASGVMQLLVPLLIILFAFSAVVGERESGTLRQLLSLGVRPVDLARGKALGIGAALGLLLVPAALVAGVAIAVSAPPGTPVRVASVLLLAAVYIAYFAVFIAVTLAVSAVTSSSRVALVGLLAFWIANVLIAPRAAADLAEWRHPLPSNEEFDASIQYALLWGLDENSPAPARAAALEDSVLAAHGAASLAELSVNFAGISLQAAENFGNVVFDYHAEAIARRIGRQQRIHRAVALGAPLLAARDLSMAIAGTDVLHHSHFAAAAEDHRRLIQRITNEDIARNGRWGEEYVAGPELWATVPRFEYTAPGLGWALSNRTTEAAVLVWWVGISLLLLNLAAARLRPE